MMRHKNLIFVSMCVLFLSGISVASRCAAEMSAAAGQVVVHGHAPLREAVKRGGSNVPLRQALAAIVPGSYSINLPNAGAWADTPVSWRGDHSLADALKQILADRPRLFADVDTDLRLVTISERASRFGSAPQGAILSETHAASVPPNADAASTGKAQISAPGWAPSRVPELQAPLAGTSNAAATAIGQQAPLLAWPTAAAPARPPPFDATQRSVSVSGEVRAAKAQPQPQPQPSAQVGGLPPLIDVPASQTAALAPTSQPQAQEWRIAPSDRTIKNALARWASEAGWQFVWDVPTDFTVDASATLHGTLQEALDAVVQALKRSQVPIQVILYKGNKVIRVVGEGAA